MRGALLLVLAPLLMQCTLDEYRKRPEPAGGSVEACASDAIWARRFGEPESAVEGPQQGSAIAWTDRCTGCGSAGCLVVAGNFLGALAFEQTAFENDADPTSLATDVFVAELCADGGSPVLWSRGFGDAPGVANRQTISDLAVDSDGNVVIVGQLTGTLLDESEAPVLTSLGAGLLPSAFVLQLSPDGTLSWARSFGADREAWASAVTIDASGRILVTGTFRGELAVSAPDQSIWVGSSPPANHGVTDAFVVALDAAGTPLFSRVFGGTGADTANSVAVRDTGELLLALGCKEDDGGPSPTTCSDQANGHDAVLAKLTSSGDAELWKHTYGDSNDDVGLFVRTQASGPIAFGGTFTVAVDFGNVSTQAEPALARHIFAASLEDTGTAASAQWAASLSTDGDDSLDALLQSPDGDVVLAGALRGANLIDPDPGVCFAYDGGADAFIVKLRGQDGSVAWGKTFGTPADEQVFDVAAGPDGTIFTIGTIVLPIDLGSGWLAGNPIEVQPDVLVAAFPP